MGVALSRFRSVRGGRLLPRGSCDRGSVRQNRGNTQPHESGEQEGAYPVSLNDRKATRARRHGLLWVTREDSPPQPYLVASARRAGEAVREIHWAVPLDGERSFGRFVELGGRHGREHPMSVKAVRPRLLAEFARAPEDVLVIYELGLVGLYAGLSKLVRRHKVVSLVGAIDTSAGPIGSHQGRPALRGAVLGFRGQQRACGGYLIRTLNVNADKIVVGWWLGLPADRRAAA
jgi:hypothetical protein